MIDRLRSEIEDVHAFISAWFRGDITRDEAAFDARLAQRRIGGQIEKASDLSDQIKQHR